jgi:hypothetical protein
MASDRIASRSGGNGSGNCIVISLYLGLPGVIRDGAIPWPRAARIGLAFDRGIATIRPANRPQVYGIC